MKKYFIAMTMILSLPLTSFSQTDAMQQKRMKLIAAVHVIKAAKLNNDENVTREMLVRGSAAVVGAATVTGGLVALKGVTIGGGHFTAGDMLLLRTSGYLVLGGSASLVLALAIPESTSSADTVTEYLKTSKGLSELFERDTESIIQSIDNVGDQQLVDMIISIARAVKNPQSVLVE